MSRAEAGQIEAAPVHVDAPDRDQAMDDDADSLSEPPTPRPRKPRAPPAGALSDGALSDDDLVDFDADSDAGGPPPTDVASTATSSPTPPPTASPTTPSPAQRPGPAPHNASARSSLGASRRPVPLRRQPTKSTEADPEHGLDEQQGLHASMWAPMMQRTAHPSIRALSAPSAPPVLAPSPMPYPGTMWAPPPGPSYAPYAPAADSQLLAMLRDIQAGQAALSARVDGRLETMDATIRVMRSDTTAALDLSRAAKDEMAHRRRRDYSPPPPPHGAHVAPQRRRSRSGSPRRGDRDGRDRHDHHSRARCQPAFGGCRWRSFSTGIHV
jgi:hypothetical protein